MTVVHVLVELPVVHVVSHLHHMSLFGLKCLIWHLRQIHCLFSAENSCRKDILAVVSQAIGG